MILFVCSQAICPMFLNLFISLVGHVVMLFQFMGTEYYQQCPFQTGNGYGDGRAISIFEGTINGKHWEMQLKGGGKTPYCRGADGRCCPTFKYS